MCKESKVNYEKTKVYIYPQVFFACIMLKLDEYEVLCQSICLSIMLGYKLFLTLNSTDIHKKIRVFVTLFYYFFW